MKRTWKAYPKVKSIRVKLHGKNNKDLSLFI